jgi:sulfite reductase alpha subunit-like flavoprotein
VTEVSILKIDPNPLAATYVDPVVWANTVAPFAVAIKPGTAGPSGTSAPIFHMLDTFLGRSQYASRLGHEMHYLRPWFAMHQRDFLDAVAHVQIRDYIEQSGDPVLKGLFQAVFDAYAGERGYLGVHRRKTYGYLEIAFKVGRQVTIGGFGGAFKDRPWNEVHAELENSREERYAGLPVQPYLASLGQRSPTTAGGPVKQVGLGIAGSGITYRPGDRVGILPENTDELVAKTLQALHADGTERVPITRQWRNAMQYRAGLEDAADLRLETFLRYAKLRPLLRSVLKALEAITASAGLRRILEARQEDQAEVWDALQLLAREGYDTSRLWSSRIWQDEAIARIVPPEAFRLYSISSAPAQQLPDQLDLTIRGVEFETRVLEGGPIRRHGTASTYLARGAQPASEASLPVLPVRPLRFRLPADPRSPIAMFAGGTGISPFRGFLLERAGQPNAGETNLFFGTRDRTEFHYHDLLERLLRDAKLRLAVAFSGQNVGVHFDPNIDGGRLVYDPAAARRIDALLEEEQHARVLYRLINGDAKSRTGGYLYICGQAAFAQSVLSAIVSAVARFSPGNTAQRQALGQLALRKLVADGRLMLDVFTTLGPAMAPGVLGSGAFNASEVALHNDEEHGYWMVVNGAVYDMNEFLHLHPGGARIILENAGLDATREYQAVQHHQHSEVDAVLSMYKLGQVRRLDFRGVWGIALRPSGMAYLSLHDLFRGWVRYLYLLVEMQNALRNDFGYLERATIRDEDPNRFSPFKAMLVANTHRRFLLSYFDGALGTELSELWANTVSLCAPNGDVGWMERELDSIRAGDHARLLPDFNRRLAVLYQVLRSADEERAVCLAEEARRLSARLRALDLRFLQDMKMAVREGVAVFEELEAQTVRNGGVRLITCLQRVPLVTAGFLAAFADEARASQAILREPTVQ